MFQTISVVASRVAKDVAMPGHCIAEFGNRLHDLEGSWSCAFEVPDRYYSTPDGRLTVRFLIPEDMVESFNQLLESFAREKELTFDPSGAVAPARPVVV